jgi:hypothetical protein
LWLDADTWVQERFALEWLIAAAANGSLAGVPEAHPAYMQSPTIVDWRANRMRDYFGDEAVTSSRWHAYVNSGVFALTADAPHWGLWAKWLGSGLERVQANIFCDQTALNHAVWKEQLPVTLLPALCNWMCHLARPRFDTEQWRFYEPGEEGRPIGIVHLAGPVKNVGLGIVTSASLGPYGLRYPGGRIR